MGERGEGEWSLKRLNSLKWKERKGGKEVEREKGEWERDEESMREREIDGGVSGWEKEGDCLKREREKEREREREGSERERKKNRCAKIVCQQWMWALCECSVHFAFGVFFCAVGKNHLNIWRFWW